MAKAPAKPTTAPPAPPAPPVPASPYTFEFVGAPPPAERVVGGEASENTKILRALADFPVAPGTTADRMPSHFFAVDPVPDTITDPAEREKAEAEHIRKLSNALSGASRKEVTARDERIGFTQRRTEKDGVRGIRVWRSK